MIKIKVKINGKDYQVEKGTNMMEFFVKNKIDVPSLCSMGDCKTVGFCGVCTVKNNDEGNLFYSCASVFDKEIDITTESDEIKKHRQENFKKILDSHAYKCKNCRRLYHCEFKEMATKLDMQKDFKAKPLKKNIEMNTTDNYIMIDEDKCIQCLRCSTACLTKSGVKALKYTYDDNDKKHLLPNGLRFDEDECVYCGQCIKACPVDAIREISFLSQIKEAIADPKKHTVIAFAPSSRMSVGHEFGIHGQNTEKKMYAASRELGFDAIFDLNNAADITIAEEATELLNNIEGGSKKTMFTSCCPGWVRYSLKNYPELKKQISTTNSPQNIYGPLAKTYYAKTKGIDPKDVYTITVVPCTAKKQELLLKNKEGDHGRDIDASLTVREFSKWIRDSKIDFKNIADGKVDKLLGEYSGGGAIFGATGGVMEAALRMTVNVLNGEEKYEKLQFNDVRGLNPVKSAKIDIKGDDKKVCVVNGTINFPKYMAEGHEDSIFTEVMKCPGGCSNGGGQPYYSSRASYEWVITNKRRIDGLYNIDKEVKGKIPNLTPAVKDLYNNFLGEPCGELSEKLIHTHNHTTEMKTSLIPPLEDIVEKI